MTAPNRVAQKTLKTLLSLEAKVDVILKNMGIPEKELKELNERLGKVAVYRSPPPNKKESLSREEVAAQVAGSPEPAKGKAKKAKPAQAKDESED